MARIGKPSIREARYHAPSPQAPKSPPQTSKWFAFLRTPKGLTFLVTAMLVTVASGVLAAVLWTQDVGLSNGSQDSDISFSDGGGGVADFATVSIGASGASASISLTGVAGAANFEVTDLLQISNSDLSQGYSITLARSAVPNAAITSLVFTVLNGATTVQTYDAVAAASGTAFTLAAGATYGIQIDMAITDGTAAGALGSLDLQFTISPV